MTTPVFTGIHIFTTFAMTGVIWFVQIVHYPLFQKVGYNNFVAYELAHTRLIGCVVIPLMLGELFSGIALINSTISTTWPWLFYTGLGLIGINWLITFTLFVPMHRSLARAYNQKICRRLVRLNWLRTIVWTVRSVFIVVMMG